MKQGIEDDRLRAEELERQRQANEKRRELERCEKERSDCLEEEAAAWSEAATLRVYVAPVVDGLTGRLDSADLEEWTSRVGNATARLDPIENGEVKRWFVSDEE